MTAARTFATSHRVLDQLRHDPRTLGLMLVLSVSLYWSFKKRDWL